MSRKRILVLAQNLPYPAYAGVDLRNWQNVNALREFGEVGVFGICSGDPRVNNPVTLPELAFYRCSRDPELGYPWLKRNLFANTWLFQPLGHPSDLYFTDVVVKELNDLMQDFKPALVIVEGLWLHRYLDLLEKFSCRTILDCHNVEGALTEEMGNAASGHDFRTRITKKILPERVKNIERKAIHRAAQVWLCSDQDKNLVERLYGRSACVHVIPNGIDISYYKETAYEADDPTGSTKARTIIFPGMYAYAPTRNAAHFLIEVLFPRVTTLFPDAQLVLPGNWPTELMLNAARLDDRIVVTGPVPDMRPYLKSSSVMMAPIFQGGGTRFKLLEAFAAGIPVVCSRKAAEGLETKDDKHLLFAEDPEQFIDRLKLLWQDYSRAEILVRNAAELVSRKYSWTPIKQKISAAINELNAMPHRTTSCRHQ